MAAAWPSATSRRRWRQCAQPASTAAPSQGSSSRASFRLVSLSATGRAPSMPKTILVILLAAVMVAVVYVLVRGVIAMASGKDLTGEEQQNWMRKRVLFQAVAVIILILIFA